MKQSKFIFLVSFFLGGFAFGETVVHLECSGVGFNSQGAGIASGMTSLVKADDKQLVMTNTHLAEGAGPRLVFQIEGQKRDALGSQVISYVAHGVLKAELELKIFSLLGLMKGLDTTMFVYHVNAHVPPGLKRNGSTLKCRVL